VSIKFDPSLMSTKAVQIKPERLGRKGFVEQTGLVKGRWSDRWWERRWWLWWGDMPRIRWTRKRVN